MRKLLDHLKEAFLEETRELLGQLEESLLELESDSSDEGLISKTFRILHTIKGSAGMFDYDEISRFTHDIENVFDLIRNGKIKADNHIITLTLRARDQIEKLLNNDGSSCSEETSEIVESFRKILLGFNEAGLPEKVKTCIVSEAVEESRTEDYLIKFKPSEGILKNGTNPLLLINELRDLGECYPCMLTNQIPPLETLEPEKCYLSWNIFLRTSRGIDSVKDVFIFVEDECELKVEVIEETGTPVGLNDCSREILDILSENSPNITRELKKLLSEKAKLPKTEKAALPANLKTEKCSDTGNAKSIKVGSEKLDYLVNLVGELVTVQARLSQISAQKNDPELILISEEVERLTCELRDNALNIRMVPIRSTFNRFKRLVRDLSQELGKKIDLFTEGEDTELDKNVIDKLNDPLVHLIRNSIDHGIEASDTRIACGKNETGSVTLSAGYAGSSVIIRITDDGAGLNREAIRKKAVEKGIITKESSLSDKELYNLIFAPGFSTAEKVSSISGRGVGMDVVKKTIESLRGNIEITSESGKGTTITLKLPLTLAIIEGLLVKISDEYFIIPLSAVEECIEMHRSEIQNENGMHLVKVRGELVPFIPLRERFNITGQSMEIEQVVITSNDGNKSSANSSKIGFVVDSVIGEHQTVIKSLGKFYKDADGFSGATILGDGTLALILDIPTLIKREEEMEKKLFQNR